MNLCYRFTLLIENNARISKSPPSLNAAVWGSEHSWGSGCSSYVKGGVNAGTGPTSLTLKAVQIETALKVEPSTADATEEEQKGDNKSIKGKNSISIPLLNSNLLTNTTFTIFLTDFCR